MSDVYRFHGVPEWPVAQDVEEAARDAEAEEGRERDRERRSAEAAEIIRAAHAEQEARGHDPTVQLRSEIGHAEARGDYTAARLLKNQYAAALVRAAGPSGAPATSPAATQASPAVQQRPRWLPITD